jgi:hypothetical protein
VKTEQKNYIDRPTQKQDCIPGQYKPQLQTVFATVKISVWSSPPETFETGIVTGAAVHNVWIKKITKHIITGMLLRGFISSS